MRWIIPTLLIVSISALFAPLNLHAQEDFNFNEIADESSQSLDGLGYHDPVFKWDMEGRVQAALNDAINYLAEGTPGLALPQLEEAIKLAPNLWVAHYYKGVCHKQLRQYREAEKEFLRVNVLNDKNIYNYMELGKTYDLLKEYNQGERYFERAIKIDESDAAPVYLLANHCAKAGMVDRARKLYKECIKTNPKMLDAEVKLAIIDFARAPKPDNKRALKYLEDVLAKDSLHQQALIFHGILKIPTEPKTSLRDWDRLVRTNPGNTKFRFMRSMLLAREKEYDKAFSDLRKVLDALQTDPNTFTGQQSDEDKRIDIEYAGFYVVANVYGLPDEDATKIRKAYCLLFLGEFDEALRSINAVKEARTSSLCLFLRGVANEHKGRHPEALLAYDSALRIDNDIIDAHKKRGVYFLELSQWKNAEYDYTQMLRINPEAYVAYRFRGLARYRDSKFREAIQDYSKYLERDSLGLEVLGERGMAYKQLGEPLPSTLDLLKSRNYQSVESFDLIAKDIGKLLAKNDTTKALWWLNQFIKLDVGYFAAHKLKLELLISQSRWPDVNASVDRALLRPGNPGGASVLFSPPDHSYLLTIKAMSLMHDDDHVDAIRELNTAIELDKKNKDAYLHRAKAQLALANKEGAAKDLKKAVSLGSKEAEEILRDIK